MSIWRQLYAMVWLAFLQILLGALSYIPSIGQHLLYGHVVLGIVILGLAHYNNVQMKKTAAPNRLKRIVKSTASLATIQPIIGLIMLSITMFQLSIPFMDSAIGILITIHLIIALAIITQASSVATAYDMWEEKEFTS